MSSLDIQNSIKMYPHTSLIIRNVFVPPFSMMMSHVDYNVKKVWRVDPHRDNESLWIIVADTTTSTMSSSWPAAATSPELNTDGDVGGLLDAVSSEEQCSRAQVGSRRTWGQFNQLFQIKQGLLNFLWIIHHFLWTVQPADTFWFATALSVFILLKLVC